MNNKANFILGDVRDIDTLRGEVLKHGIIFHFASAVGIAQSMYRPSTYMSTNLVGTTNLYDILRKIWTRSGPEQIF